MCGKRAHRSTARDAARSSSTRNALAGAATRVAEAAPCAVTSAPSLGTREPPAPLLAARAALSARSVRPRRRLLFSHSNGSNCELASASPKAPSASSHSSTRSSRSGAATGCCGQRCRQGELTRLAGWPLGCSHQGACRGPAVTRAEDRKTSFSNRILSVSPACERILLEEVSMQNGAQLVVSEHQAETTSRCVQTWRPTH
mmetsp:Transcript_143277/g.399423  ORF Transcript_143277/g.399423 Transcript_143277/m.399423 type:complete len:201 (-) Transcript_143277:25-627(-)